MHMRVHGPHTTSGREVMSGELLASTRLREVAINGITDEVLTSRGELYAVGAADLVGWQKEENGRATQTRPLPEQCSKPAGSVK